jgi:hypothetical protein
VTKKTSLKRPSGAAPSTDGDGRRGGIEPCMHACHHRSRTPIRLLARMHARPPLLDGEWKAASPSLLARLTGCFFVHVCAYVCARELERACMRKQRKRKGMDGEVRADHCVVFLILCKPCQNVARDRISRRWCGLSVPGEDTLRSGHVPGTRACSRHPLIRSGVSLRE